MSNNPIYIVGGRKTLRTDHNYDRGVVLLKDDTGIRVVQEYITPEELNPHNRNVVFKCATKVEDRMYCCTQNEVIVFSLPDFVQIQHFVHPLFAGVHYVLPKSNGNLLVGAAALDLVLEIDSAGALVTTYQITEEETDFDLSIDYRTDFHIKPSHSHLNHLVAVDGEIFVTRFKKQDAVSMTDISRKIDVGVENTHDGFLFDSQLYFTTIDGHVVVADPVTLGVTNQYLLNTMAPSWCRGLLVDQETSWVGFSRFNQPGMTSGPTRISRYNTQDWMLWEEIDLESYGLDTIYSIIDAS